MFTRDNPYGYEDSGAYLNTQLCYEKMRQVAISQEYKKVWIVESDTIPPEDALAKLLEIDAPIVSGIYVLRHGSQISNLLRLSSGTPRDGQGIWWDELKSHWGETIEVSGACMGCLLVDTEVLKGFSFLTGLNHYPDMDFMQYCYTNKFKQMARLDVLCGHKKANGDILWPDKEQGWRIAPAQTLKPS